MLKESEAVWVLGLDAGRSASPRVQPCCVHLPARSARY